RSACDVSGAAHLPAALTAELPETAAVGGAVTALRLEGFAPSVSHRRRVLEDLVAPFGEAMAAGPAASERLWRAVRDAVPCTAGGPYGERPLWRLSVPPSRGAEVGEMLA